MANNDTVYKDMTVLKVRMWTPDIPPNAVLVGHSILTKNPRIYKNMFFHLPWFKSKFVTMQNKNTDLEPKKFELGGADGGLEITSDVAVTFRVKPIDPNMKMGFKEKWASIFHKFKTKPVSSILKTVLFTAATVAGGVFAWPLAIALPLTAATYISTGYQDKEWVKEQGAYKAAYESRAAMAEMEQIIYEELRAFYASHGWDQVKGLKVDFSKPEFADLKDKLDIFANEYGIEVIKVAIKTADLTPESNDILQRQKEAAMKAEEIRQQAAAQEAVHNRNIQYANDLLRQGFSPEQVAQIMQIEAARGTNAFVNVGGAPMQPMFTMPVPGGQPVQPGEQPEGPTHRRQL